MYTAIQIKSALRFHQLINLGSLPRPSTKAGFPPTNEMYWTIRADHTSTRSNPMEGKRNREIAAALNLLVENRRFREVVIGEYYRASSEHFDFATPGSCKSIFKEEYRYREPSLACWDYDTISQNDIFIDWDKLSKSYRVLWTERLLKKYILRLNKAALLGSETFPLNSKLLGALAPSEDDLISNSQRLWVQLYSAFINDDVVKYLLLTSQTLH